MNAVYIPSRRNMHPIAMARNAYPEPMSPVQPVWFDEIAAGRKTVEGRAGACGKYDAFVGKRICLRRGEGTSPTHSPTSVIAEITAVRHYATLEEYIRGEGWEAIAPHLYSAGLSDLQLNVRVRDAYLAIFAHSTQSSYQVFSPNRVSERKGINAVELKVIGSRAQLPAAGPQRNCSIEGGTKKCAFN